MTTPRCHECKAEVEPMGATICDGCGEVPSDEDELLCSRCRAEEEAEERERCAAEVERLRGHFTAGANADECLAEERLATALDILRWASGAFILLGYQEHWRRIAASFVGQLEEMGLNGKGSMGHGVSLGVFDRPMDVRAPPAEGAAPDAPAGEPAALEWHEVPGGYWSTIDNTPEGLSIIVTGDATYGEVSIQVATQTIPAARVEAERIARAAGLLGAQPAQPRLTPEEREALRAVTRHVDGWYVPLEEVHAAVLTLAPLLEATPAGEGESK